MNIGVVNKSTTVNRFVLHTLQRNTTHLAEMTSNTNMKIGIFKRGTGKEPKFYQQFFFTYVIFCVQFFIRVIILCWKNSYDLVSSIA